MLNLLLSEKNWSLLNLFGKHIPIGLMLMGKGYAYGIVWRFLVLPLKNFQNLLLAFCVNISDMVDVMNKIN